MKTNWQDPKTSEIISPHISGLQEAIGKIEDTLNMDTASDAGIALSEVYISEDDRYRIYQAPEGKRNWTGSPVIKRNGSVIATGFSIEHGGGAIVLDANATSGDTFTADAEYMVESVVSSTKTARFVVGTSTAGWTNRDCDYLCDGTNDHVEINAAIQALPAGGGEIVVLDGTYSIGAEIVVDKDSVILRGNGGGTVLNRGFSHPEYEDVGVITLKNSSNCMVKGFQIVGNSGTYTGNNHAVYADSSYYFTILNIFSQDNSGCGIKAEGCGECLIERNVSFDNGYNDIRISNTDYSVLKDNACQGSGIYLTGSDNAVISGNNCSEGYSGIGAYNSNNMSIVNNICKDCIDEAAIELSACSRNSIIGNTCIRGTGAAGDYSGSQHTIKLAGSSNTNNLISNNNCMGKAPTVDGGTGNTLFNNKWDASSDFERHEATLVTGASGVHGLKIEEGTWTPVLYGTTTEGTNTYSTQSGHYYKVGKMVFCTFQITLSAKDASMAGSVRIKGLPFAASLSTRGIHSRQAGITLGSYTTVGGQLDTSTSFIVLYKQNPSWDALASADITNSAGILMSFVYIA